MPDREDDLEDELAQRPMGALLKRKSWFDPASNTPWLQRAGDDLQDRAQDRHQERSEAAREADASFNAPIADSYAQWAQAPNRYDIPGVDTIPGYRQSERAERFLQQARDIDAVRKVETIEAGMTRGQHKRSERRVGLAEDLRDDADYPREGRPYVLAHEVGHAIDSHAAEVKEEQVGEDEKWRVAPNMGWEMTGGHDIYDVLGGDVSNVRDANTELAEEMKGLSERVRGRIDESDRQYRKDMGEITADAIALSVLEPRAAKRDYPLAYSTIQDEFFERMRPLEADR